MSTFTNVLRIVHLRVVRPGIGRLDRRDQGASLVEYALLVALIALVCIAAVAFFGEQTSTRFSTVGSEIDAT